MQVPLPQQVDEASQHRELFLITPAFHPKRAYVYDLRIQMWAHLTLGSLHWKNSFLWRERHSAALPSQLPHDRWDPWKESPNPPPAGTMW
jgi:hypothetical protein